MSEKEIMILLKCKCCGSHDIDMLEDDCDSVKRKVKCNSCGFNNLDSEQTYSYRPKQEIIIIKRKK